MLTVCCSKWGALFSARHVNVLRAALERHLRLPHEIVCVTNEPDGIDPRVRIVPMPEAFASTARCRRRMQFFSREFCEAHLGGRRTLFIDLDVVIVADLTPIVAVDAPLAMWRVGHADVFSGSFILADPGVLDGAWQRFKADPVAFPREAQPSGVGSDQAMLNWWLQRHPMPGMWQWTEASGFVTYYGRGYERLEHLGVGPTRPALPAGARIVVLGSADLEVLHSSAYPWVREHWTALAIATSPAVA